MISFVVHKQEWQLRHKPAASLLVPGVGDMVLDPCQQSREYCFVLLDNEQPRPLFRAYAKVSRYGGREVAVIGPVSYVIRSDRRISVLLTDADRRGIAY